MDSSLQGDEERISFPFKGVHAFASQSIEAPGAAASNMRINVFPGCRQEACIFKLVQDGVERPAAEVERSGKGETIVLVGAVVQQGKNTQCIWCQTHSVGHAPTFDYRV